jgi:hypothetical protein
VDALEPLADADHIVFGVRNHARQELVVASTTTEWTYPDSFQTTG